MNFSFFTIFGGGGGWHMKTCDKRLLRPEWSSAARRCAYLFIDSDLYEVRPGTPPLRQQT